MLGNPDDSSGLGVEKRTAGSKEVPNGPQEGGELNRIAGDPKIWDFERFDTLEVVKFLPHEVMERGVRLRL
jgi:hypothetical protein